MISNVELFEKMKRFEWLLHQKYFLDVRSGTPLADITRGQGRILLTLAHCDEGLSTKELSSQIGIRVSSVNELLSKMEGKGLIKREPSEKDKRVIINKLTLAGREMIPNTGIDFPFFSCLSSEEQETFGRMLDKVNESLREYLESRGAEKLEDICSQREKAMRAYLESQGKEAPFPPIIAPFAVFEGKEN